MNGFFFAPKSCRLKLQEKLFFLYAFKWNWGEKIVIIPSAMFAPRWTSEVFWAPPRWKSWSSLGRVRPRSVATPRQAARLCLHRLQLLLSRCGDTCAHGLFVVLHLQRLRWNRELWLIRHANIWWGGGLKGSWIMKQEDWEKRQRGKPVAVQATQTCSR